MTRDYEKGFQDAVNVVEAELRFWKRANSLSAPERCDSLKFVLLKLNNKYVEEYRK